MMNDLAACVADVRGYRCEARSIETSYSWWLAAIAVLIGSLSFGAVTSVPILLKPLSHDWGAGAGTMALVHTSAMFGAAAGSLLLGRVFDRFGFFGMALLAATATGAGLLIAASAQNLLTLHLAYGVLIGGIGQGAFFSPLTAAVSQWFDRHRALAIAIVACGQSVGGLTLPPLMRWGAHAFGWRATLVTYGLVAGLVLVVCTLAFRRAPPPPVSAPDMSVAGKAVLSAAQGGFLMLGLAMALTNHASFMVMAHLTAFGEDQGFAPTAAAALVSAMLGVSLVSRLAVGKLSMRWGHHRTLLATTLLLVLGITWLAMAQGSVAIALGAVLVGLGFGSYVPGYAILAREMFPAAQAGRRIAEIFCFAFVAAGVGSWSSGWLRDLTGGYGVPFVVAACSAGLAVAVLLRLRKPLQSV